MRKLNIVEINSILANKQHDNSLHFMTILNPMKLGYPPGMIDQANNFLNHFLIGETQINDILYEGKEY